MYVEGEWTTLSLFIEMIQKDTKKDVKSVTIKNGTLEKVEFYKTPAYLYDSTTKLIKEYIEEGQ